MQEFNTQTNLFFRNMKDKPPVNHNWGSPYMDLIQWERQKCIEGININGYQMSGPLYYFLNHVMIDVENEAGDLEIVIPTIRDTDFEIFEGYQQARESRLGLLIGAARQLGKDLLNSSLLYKKDKEIQIGDAKVGDEIYDDQGNLTRIKGVYPQGLRPVYKITLLDGRKIFCGLDHNWYVFNNSKRKFETLTTRDLIKDYKRFRESWKNRNNPYTYNYSIPTAEYVKYEEKELLISPYLLGIWLGDCNSANQGITTADPEIVEYIYNEAKTLNYKVKKRKDYTYFITSETNTNLLVQTLKFYKLKDNKHIPNVYLYSSFEQRLELLQGLLDSDGTCNSGVPIFYNTNYTLIKQVEKLVRSLGMTCKLTKKQGKYKNKNNKIVYCKICYILTIYTNNPDVFKLQRKRQLVSSSSYSKKTSIVDITYVKDDFTTCIEVDNNSHLFLTDDYTITHNSTTQVTLATHELFFKKNAEVVALFSTTSDKQTFTKKLDIQLKNNTEALVVPTIDKSLDKKEIRFGITLKDNTTEIFSKLFVLLTEEGNNTETGAGKSTTLALFDEIAKYPCHKVHEALIPALKSQRRGGGLRSGLIYTFTGGDVEKGQDAKKIFENPEFYHFKAFGKEGKGFFLPGEYHGTYKKESTIGEYFKTAKNIDISDTDLETVPMLVTDWEYATEELDREENIAKKTDLVAYNKRKMYAPRNTKDIFISGTDNPFAHLYSEFEALLHYLKDKIKEYKVVDFIKSNGEVQPVEVNKPILTTFPPQRDAASINTGIVICSPPVNVSHVKYYVGGADPFNVDKTDNSASLGSFYIMQKRTDDYTDSDNESIVAYYNGRKDIRDFRNKLRNTLIYYGALVGGVTLLHEAADDSLTQWFSEQNETYFLEETYNLSREINPKYSGHNAYGLRPTPNNQSYYISRALDYFEEELPDGRLGLWRLKDPYLVEQVLNYDGDLSDKDALVAFGHSITHLFKERKYAAPTKPKEVVEEVIKSRFKSAFGSAQKPRRKYVI